jgi:hypothetical protein
MFSLKSDGSLTSALAHGEARQRLANKKSAVLVTSVDERIVVPSFPRLGMPAILLAAENRELTYIGLDPDFQGC